MITKHATSRTLLIHAQSTLDALRVEHCRQQVKSFLAEGYLNLIFDMSDTVYINSSGLGWLVESYQTVRKMGGNFKVLNISPQVELLFKQAHLDRLLLETVAPEAESADPEATERASFDRLHELMSTEIYMLSQTNQIIARALKLETAEEIATEILQGAMDMCHASFGCLFLVDEGRHHLRLAREICADGSVRVPNEQVSSYALRPGRIEHQLLQDSEVLWQPLHEIDPLQARLFIDFGFTQLLASSIRGREAAYGLIALEGTDATRELLLIAKPLLAAFTQLCGQAMENASLSHKLKERNTELNHTLTRLHESHLALSSAGHLAAVGTAVTGIGHQLNNQLGPLVGYCELLSRQTELPPEVHDRIDVIHTAGAEMQRAIKKLLHIARTQNGTAAQLEVHECVRVTLDLLLGLTESSQIKITLDLNAQATVMPRSSEALIQALLSLLHRSCTSFAPDQTERTVTISSSTTHQFLHIKISDDGPPLSDEDMAEQLDPLMPFDNLRRGQIFSPTLPRTLVSRLGGMLNLSNLAGGGKAAIIDLPLI